MDLMELYEHQVLLLHLFPCPKKSGRKKEPACFAQVGFIFRAINGKRIQKKLAERTGLEPATPGVTGRYSNQLNYRSILVGGTGIEPVTYAL